MSEEGVRNETALIGSALLEPGRVMPLMLEARCKPEWFEDARCRTAWRGFKQLWDEKKMFGIDMLTLLDVLKRVGKGAGTGGMDRGRDFNAETQRRGDAEECELDMGWLSGLVDGTPTAAHAEYYLGIVRDQYLCRKGKRLAQGFAASLESGPALAVQKFQAGLVDIMSEATGNQDAGNAATGEQVMEDWRKAHQIRMVEKRMDYCPGVALPWRVMTMQYNGMQPGLHVLAARPSTGKTALVNNMIRWWCEELGLHVGFDSLDMQPRQFMKRLVSERSRVSLAKAEFGTTSERDLAKLETAAREHIGQWPLHVTVKRDLEALRSWAMMRRLKGELDVLVVDFMQLMEFEGCYRMGSDDRVSRISGTLKAIGNDLDIPVLALSQLNRQCEEDGGREPQLSDLRGSGAIEQDAFTVMFLHTDPTVRANWELCPPIQLSPFGASLEARQYTAKQLRPVWGLLKKNQNGRTGRLPLVLFPNYFLFMLGDYNAEPLRGGGEGSSKVGEFESSKVGSGGGGWKKTKVDYSPLFGRVMGDWRRDPMEEALGKSGGMVAGYSDGE